MEAAIPNTNEAGVALQEYAEGGALLLLTTLGFIVHLMNGKRDFQCHPKCSFSILNGYGRVISGNVTFFVGGLVNIFDFFLLCPAGNLLLWQRS